MSLESILRELGKEIQADPRFKALQEAAAANDKDENLQQQMKELQLISLKYQQEATKGEEADEETIKDLQTQYQDLYNEVMKGEEYVRKEGYEAKYDELLSRRFRNGADGSVHQRYDWPFLRRSGPRNLRASRS